MLSLYTCHLLPHHLLPCHLLLCTERTAVSRAHGPRAPLDGFTLRPPGSPLHACWGDFQGSRLPSWAHRAGLSTPGVCSHLYPAAHPSTWGQLSPAIHPSSHASPRPASPIHDPHGQPPTCHQSLTHPSALAQLADPCQLIHVLSSHPQPVHPHPCILPAPTTQCTPPADPHPPTPTTTSWSSFHLRTMH